MDTNKGGRVAANEKRIETWEQLRERLFRLAELGDELAAVAAGAAVTWLYREIEAEAATVAEVAGAYIDECERLDRLPDTGSDLPARLGGAARQPRGTGSALAGAINDDASHVLRALGAQRRAEFEAMSHLDVEQSR